MASARWAIEMLPDAYPIMVLAEHISYLRNSLVFGQEPHSRFTLAITCIWDEPCLATTAHVSVADGLERVIT